MEKIKVVHLTASVSREAGGLFESVRYLAKSTSRIEKLDLRIIGLTDRHTNQDFKEWFPLDVRTHAIRGWKRFGYAPGLYRDLRNSAPDLVHLHGLWKYPSVVVRRWASHSGRPYLVSPHGMMEPWALQQAHWRKGMANFLYQSPCLNGAACIRATSQMEADSIRLAGYVNPIAIIPNGVELPILQKAEGGGRKSEIRRALFLSRIHPKKGLINLVKAWAEIRKSKIRNQKLSDWELVIAGPDEGGHLAEVKALVEACGLQQQVFFPGEIRGAARTRLYREADLFILPSFSENFGLVVAEALSCEVPVITTRATPWQEIPEHQCGWWIEVGVAPLVEALKEAFAIPSDQLFQMGVRGRKLIAEKYDWTPIGQRMVEVYEWMLHRRSKPDCVVV